jgi:hypothetical protein
MITQELHLIQLKHYMTRITLKRFKSFVKTLDSIQLTPHVIGLIDMYQCSLIRINLHMRSQDTIQTPSFGGLHRFNLHMEIV